MKEQQKIYYTHTTQQKIIELAQTDPYLAAAVQLWQQNQISWEDALQWAIVLLLQRIHDKNSSIANRDNPVSVEVIKPD